MFEAGSPKSRALELHRRLGGQLRHIEHDVAQIAAEIRDSEARGLEWAADYAFTRGMIATAHVYRARAKELKGADIDRASL